MLLDSYVDQAFAAEIMRIILFMDQRLRIFKVEACFMETFAMLYPNFMVEVSIVLCMKENVLIVLASYVVDNGFVLIGKDEWKVVKLGARDLQ